MPPRKGKGSLPNLSVSITLVFHNPVDGKENPSGKKFFIVCEREELDSRTAEAIEMENLKDPPRRPRRKELSDWQRWRFPLGVWTAS